MKTSLLLAAGCLTIGVITGIAGTRLTLGSPAAESINTSANQQLADASTNQSATQNPFATTKPALSQNESAGSGSRVDLQTVIPTELSSSAQVMAALQAIASADSQSIVSLARSRPNGWEVDAAEQLITRAVFERWAIIDLPASLAWLGEQLNSDINSSSQELLMQSVSGIAAADATALQEWINTNAPEEWSDILADAMWREQGRENPESALAQLRGDENSYLQHSVFGEWATRDPNAALEWLQKRASADERIALSELALEALLGRDPDAALELIRGMTDNPDQPWLMARYAGVLAQTDPAAAATFVMNETNPEMQLQAFAEISWQWAESDPQALQQFIESIPDALQRQQFFLMVAPAMASQFSEENPQAAMQWAETLAPGEREIALPHAFDQWLYTETDAALAWLDTQPDSPATSQMRNSAMWILPSTDINRAVAVFPTLDPELQRELSWSMAEALAVESPDDFNQWVGSLESPELRQSAMLAGEVSIARQDPEAWLDAIHSSNGDVRANRLYAMYTSVRSEFPDLVNTWMQMNPLSVEDEQKLIQRMQTESYDGYVH